MTLEEALAENTSLKAQIATLESAQERVNREAKSHRLNAEAFQRQAEDFRKQTETLIAERDAGVAKISKALEEQKIDFTAQIAAAQKERDGVREAYKARRTDLDLSSVAARMGMSDMDGLKLLDRNGLKLGDDGEVQNADEVLTAFKSAKPYFFGPVSTANPRNTPPPPDTTTKYVAGMTAEQRQAGARALGINPRHFRN